MIEIIIASIIVVLAGAIIMKSVRNSSNGKCNCGCDLCKAKNSCSEKNNDSN
ncbi:virus attachment protein p12 family protein [Clostridium puniceum]|uniref:Virus attachment protein p12 family protein n=1 Tax=Clostridium puniceum TaxID=29367 RepID=A0A1S8TI79_9CLOT|nr:FeoB-associated Cys-rich membrane protein [Clostridium puniceum]OOM77386.1 virus attachment protein p12 family protein [Clostridium puniceum]